jgi:oxaloacetate decarboxylase alpha subunit
MKMFDFLKKLSTQREEVNTQKVGITELVFRDAHQSLFATRMRIDDMLPIAEKLDNVGYWSMESWGGATFDSCIRYLGEDPWIVLEKSKRLCLKHLSRCYLEVKIY